jgi:beta-mannanase
VLAFNLIPADLENFNDPLSWESSCAAGDFDSHATTLGRSLVAAGLQNSVLRLGPEMNGEWESDFVGTTTVEQQNWAKCFANEVTSLRRASGEHFLIVWNPNACVQAYPFSNYYPGNKFVDIVGLDLYDVGCDAPDVSLSFGQLATETVGLRYFEAFARSHHKPMSFPEWGLSTSPAGDDPAYVDGIGETVSESDFAFQSYFDVSGTGGVSLNVLALGPSTPQSLLAYQQWFGTSK